ncbi:MAG: hypothetical protein IT244_03410 [Bacteroidia bacterium]|nr:hypothetical protein [Bacteroidia bacterium]
MYKYLKLSLLGLVYLASCKPEKKACCDSIPTTNATKALVLCEGNFQWGNADFDVFIPDSNKLYPGVYKAQNNGALGDVLQSGYVGDNGVWLVMNNSGKLVCIDRNTFKFKSEIKGLKSPRYVVIDGETAVVSELYDNRIHIVNLKTNAQSHIQVNGWTEQLCLTAKGIAVASKRGAVYWLNSNKTAIEDSTLVRSGAGWMATDKNGKLWLLASDSGKSMLYKINVETRRIENQMPVGSGGYSQKIAMSLHKDSVFFLGNGVFGMPISALEAPTVPLFVEKGANYYGLAVDPFSGNLYVSDAKDYVSKGEVIVLHGNGAVVHRFNTGINPGEFLFYR